MTVETDTPGSAGEAHREETSEVRFIPLGQIYVPSSHRRTGKKRVLELANSIEEIGLKTPISVVKQERGAGDERTLYDLVAGAHRLAAHRQLERAEIPAIIMFDNDPLRVELWGIDENLMRSELSPGERSQALARRKEIYVKLHPDTKVGRAQAAGMRKKRRGDVGGKSTPTFVKATAAATGMSRSSIEKETRVGERVAKDVFDMLNGTRFDKAVEWHSIEHLTHDQQRHVAQIALKSDTSSLREIIEREYPCKRKGASRAGEGRAAERVTAIEKRVEPVTTVERIAGPTGPITKGFGSPTSESTNGLAPTEAAAPADAAAPAEPVTEPHQIRAGEPQAVPPAVDAEPPTVTRQERLFLAWTDALVLDRVALLSGLGLTRDSAKLLAERALVIDDESVIAAADARAPLLVQEISLVAEVHKRQRPHTRDQRLADFRAKVERLSEGSLSALIWYANAVTDAVTELSAQNDGWCVVELAAEYASAVARGAWEREQYSAVVRSKTEPVIDASRAPATSDAPEEPKTTSGSPEEMQSSAHSVTEVSAVADDLAPSEGSAKGGATR